MIKMAQIIKIVLTGGPCAGKTSALTYLQSELEQRGVSVFCVEETATKLINRGKTPESMGIYDFHRLLFETQLAEERCQEALAASDQAEKRVVLCDRGLMDSKAYVTPEDFARYSADCGWTENRILCAYDAVFHMVTAADGAESNYSTQNNQARSEDIVLARQRDEDVKAVWVGTPHLRVIDNSTDFNGKLRRLLAETLAVVGIPEPLEIERKFLILYPNIGELAAMPLCRCVPMTQTYLDTPDEGKLRVRRRGEGEDAVYIKTIKRKISDLRRVEIEDLISKEEYERYISKKEYCHGTIAKNRYCILWRDTYYELDVFPFWNQVALLEIELLSENQPFELPDFVAVLREVTHEKQFRNKSLALQYGK